MVVIHLVLMHHSPDATMHMGVTLAGLQAVVAVLARTGRRNPVG